ncbi:hypothetical protein [Streptomyces solincola]|uniref:hypothetical protein n=1 Tax=Streptomyces solincola TaxID=2100817 RepID=UPI0015E48788|nr:hypothetical protein [Streptomyces solincola]
MIKVGYMAKAVVAAFAAAAGTLVAVTQDGMVDTGDVVTVVLSVLGALGVTYAVPNKG